MIKPGKSLSQEFEIQEYISTFRSSSDRVRIVLYIVVVVSVALAILTWTTRETSYGQWRYNEWQRLAALKGQYEYEVARSAGLPADPKREAQLAAMRRELVRYDERAEYMKQLVGRVQLLSLPPLIGTTVDFNDAGTVGGILLMLLLTLLVFCFVRQHENLFLCTFKITRLCEGDAKHSDGESDANFLYHALVMTQVLNHPPTLARWRAGKSVRSLKWLRRLTFFVPTLAYLYVVGTDALSLLSRGNFGWRVQAELAILAGLLILGISCCLLVDACEHRWRRSFFEINPHLRGDRQSSLAQWLHMHRLRPAEPLPDETKLREKLGGEPLFSPPDLESGTARIVATLPLDAKSPGDDLQEEMARVIHREAIRQARGSRPAEIDVDDIEDITLGDPVVKNNASSEQRWIVQVEWPYVRKRRLDAKLRAEAPVSAAEPYAAPPAIVPPAAVPAPRIPVAGEVPHPGR